MNCKFCGKEILNPGALTQHERKCKLNPNKYIPEKMECPFCKKEYLGLERITKSY